MQQSSLPFLQPFRIKTVEPIKYSSYEQRKAQLKQAHYTPFMLKSKDCPIDLLTDSGVSAMSMQQWSALMLADQAYQSSQSDERFCKVVTDVTGYQYRYPIHQGRVGQHLLALRYLSKKLESGKQYKIPNNGHFVTGLMNIKFFNSLPLNFTVSEESQDFDPNFQGNIDVDKVRSLIESQDKQVIPYGILTITNNNNGGQPVSIKNMKKCWELFKQKDIPLYYDACRFAQNAFMIKKFEEGYENTPLKQIIREQFKYSTGAFVSLKKDGLSNMGGFFATHDEKVLKQFNQIFIMMEGNYTYGGMSSRDIQAATIGIQEVIDQNFQEYRYKHVVYLGKKLEQKGVIIKKPYTTCIFVDIQKIFSHLSVEEQNERNVDVAFMNEMFLQGSVRCLNLGKMLGGNSLAVRMAIGRRVYTKNHLDYVAEVAGKVMARIKDLPAYRKVDVGYQLMQ